MRQEDWVDTDGQILLTETTVTQDGVVTKDTTTYRRRRDVEMPIELWVQGDSR